MMPEHRVLIVEDDAALAQVICHNLRQEGFEPRWEANGNAALIAARVSPPDIALLDITLPGRDGFELCSMWRAEGRFPIIFVTSRDRLDDKLRGLNLGADDYIVKPFVIAELIARMHAVLRRTRPHNVQWVTIGTTVIDFVKFTAKRGDTIIDLSHREFTLLRYLVERANTPVTRGELLRHVWGYPDEPFTRAVDKAIARLRKKLGNDPKALVALHTAHGNGYQLALGPSDTHSSGDSMK